jgi:methyltransferase-like protein/2-polyprenyl-3-methyl-5-hydroxy-6-metoxy-1,4-benzoquinol methylase
MNEITEKLRADYDAVEYEALEHVHAHPDRIAVVAALGGLAPPRVDNCRVLEIACATGGHLLPMSEQMPGSRFVGIDLSPRQIDRGAAIIREVGLTNIELRCQDLMDFPEDAGEFDYIIAHGFYSWVPGVVQNKLMDICRRHLSKNGLAYISYNTLPGWRAKGVIRDMMLFHSRGATDRTERIRRGREMVQFVAENISYDGFYRNMVGFFQKSMSEQADSYLLHDHIEVVNEAIYLRDFVDRANAYGLTLVGDTNANDDYWGRIPAAARDTISKLSADVVERDQYMDFLTNRMFRRSVLCRADAATFSREPAADEIRKLYIAGNPAENAVGVNSAGRKVFEFGTKDNKVQLSDSRPIAAMRRLREAWPSALSFSDLAATALEAAPENQRDSEKNAVAMAHVIETCYSLGIIELWTRPMDHIARVPGEFPRATRLARWQVVRLPTVTSLRHTRVGAEPALRQLLPLLDGTRDIDGLAAEVAKQNKHAPDRETLKKMIGAALQKLAMASLLIKN